MSDIRILELSNYVRPKLQENISKDWVLNGKNNSFYKDIIDRKNGSPTNNAIINSYTSLMYGKGLYDLGQSRNATNFLKFKQMISAKEVRKIVADFKLFGEASIQVIKANKKTELPTLLHVPQNKLAPQLENEDGEIEGYWYCKDWEKQNKNTPIYYPVFGTSNESIEIYTIKPYNAGNEYFTDPDWLSGFPYAIMEEEIANLYVNCIKNGLSAGVIVNIPDGNSLTDEQKDTLERKIKAKLTGSNNAGTFVINFKGSDADITVTVLPINDNIHKQWEYLTSEAKQQLLTAHQVTSPMLFGIKDSTGLGNNADELNEAFELLMDSVINPKQLYLTDAFEEIANAYGVVLNLAFKKLKDNDSETSKDESFTGIQISSAIDIISKVKTKELNRQQAESILRSMLKFPESEIKNIFSKESTTLSLKKKETIDNVADELIALGEEISGEWELYHSEILNDANIELASTGTARPNAKSEIDGQKFKSRLRYGGKISENSREFCVKMLNANKLYRIEDINMMSNKVVNAGWGANGSDTYDILKFKGGGACRHFWIRESYRLKADVNNPNAEIITPSKARKEGEILPKLDKIVYEKPNNMPNNGFLKPRN